MGFADTVRHETAIDHERAERSPFVGALLAGQLHRRAYVDLLRALLPVYLTLEQCLLGCADEASIALFDHRRLDRRDRIAADLRAFGQDSEWAGQVMLPATVGYVDLVRRAAVSPQRLLAHHYTRYLGDMAGGRVIASRLMSQYDVDPVALTYYDFSELGDVHHYRKQYKVLLDLVPWTAAERGEFVSECTLAYRANAVLFEQLAEVSGLSTAGPSTVGTFLASERRHVVR